MTKNILFINHSNMMLGAETVLLQVIETCYKAGCNCYLATPQDASDMGFAENVEKMVGKGHAIRMPYKIYGFGRVRNIIVKVYNLFALMIFTRWCRQHNIDTIYSNTCLNCIGVKIAKKMQIRHIWHFHEPVDQSFGWADSYKNWFADLLSYEKNHVVFISKKQRNEWERELGVSISGSIVYNNHKIIRRIERKAGENVIFGFIGGFTKRKNIDAVIAAFKRIHRMYPNTRLFLCGAKNAVEVEEYSDDAIIVEQRTNDVESFYNKIDVLLLLSYMETMPLVVIEAMQAGTCVIQTTRSGMGELFEDGRDTFFVEPDDINTIVEKMVYMMETKNRQDMVNNGIKRIEEFNLNEQFENNILSIIDQA